MKTPRYLLLVLIVAIYLFFQFSIIGFAQQDCITPMTAQECFVKVTKIVDGDTFEFVYDNTPFRVRISGLDAYETTKSKKAKSQAKRLNVSVDVIKKKGIKAKSFAEKYLLNKEVKLIRQDKDNQEDFGGLLRKVYVDGVPFDSLVIAKKLGYKYKKSN